MTRDRRIGLVALGLGVLLIGFAQRVAPLTEPPLYDGVYVPQPYVWLVPPAGAKGGAKGAKGSVGVDGTANRLIAVATPEQDPQAQLLATSGALVLPPGTTTVKFSIEPVLPVELPADGHIDGNVYRISVTNDAGTPLTAPASALVTVVMVSPHTDPDRSIELDNGQGWQKLTTQNQGPGVWLAVVTAFGEFAVVAPGAATAPYPTATPVPGASAPASGPPASASTGPGPSTEPVPSIGQVGGSPTPGPSLAPAASSGSGGLPLIPIGIGVVAVIVLAGLVLSRGRRKPPNRPPPTYRGAHRL
ncbi:MAG TPA: hypothetical protein VKR24_10685 [Candidatus Limnocylindrales bacterium]|nr:hypothetical protein [Candidatus Limnocylindrales bacterium]